MKYYPLRPELAESTFYLYQATKDPWYLDVGESMVKSLNLYTKVPGGFASVRDVTTMQLEDHQHSFFLAETCVHFLIRYSFLTYTMQNITLVVISLSSQSGAWESRASALSLQVCPLISLNSRHPEQHRESACHVPDEQINHKCRSNKECGVDATTCRLRTCSGVGYCGLWNPL
ncbi:unnamed protein product [Arabidopsis halleri]